MIKALIFDFFGVIGQSTYAYIKDVYKTSPKQTLDLSDLHRSLDYGFINKADFITQYSNILDVTTEEISRLFNDADNHFSTSKLLLDFIDNNRTKYKMGLLSNVSGDTYHKFIEPITNHFDAVVTSYTVKLAKPDIEIYKIIANKLDLDVSECLMIDDNKTNCEGAMAAGMQAICYKDYNQFINGLSDLLSNFEK